MKAIAHLYGFKAWYDRRIKPGFYWNDSIKTRVEESNIFVLLVSNEFFASDYILDYELPAILERHKKSNALVIPVIYRASSWRGYFGQYIQVAPKNIKHNLVPICQWRDREEAFAVAANDISSSIQDWFGVAPKGFPSSAARGCKS